MILVMYRLLFDLKEKSFFHFSFSMVRGNTEKQIASTIRGVSSELAEDVDSLNANGGRGILVSVYSLYSAK